MKNVRKTLKVFKCLNFSLILALASTTSSGAAMRVVHIPEQHWSFFKEHEKVIKEVYSRALERLKQDLDDPNRDSEVENFKTYLETNHLKVEEAVEPIAADAIYKVLRRPYHAFSLLELEEPFKDPNFLDKSHVYSIEFPDVQNNPKVQEPCNRYPEQK